MRSPKRGRGRKGWLQSPSGNMKTQGLFVCLEKGWKESRGWFEGEKGHWKQAGDAEDNF